MLLINDGEIHVRKLRAKELRKSSKSRKGFALKRGRDFIWDSWIIVPKIPCFWDSQENLDQKKDSRIAESDLSRLFPFHSGMFGGSFSFQKLTSFRFRSIFFQDSTGVKPRPLALRHVKPLPSDSKHLPLIPFTCAVEGAEDVVQIFDEFSPTQMVSFSNTQNGDFKNYVYKFIYIYTYIYTGLVNIIIIWNTNIMYSQTLQETLVHPEFSPEKNLIQFESRHPEEVKGMDHGIM